MGADRPIFMNIILIEYCEIIMMILWAALDDFQSSLNYYCLIYSAIYKCMEVIKILFYLQVLTEKQTGHQHA